MADTDKLRRLVRSFRFHAKPSNGDHSAPCTIRDLNDVIDKVSKLLEDFIDELENE